LLSDQGWEHSTMVSAKSQGHFFAILRVLLTFSLLMGLGVQPAQARRALADAPAQVAQQADTIALSALPRAGQSVYQRIAQGGPFDYGKDGTVFGNRERQLPAQKRGFYHEYTVPTPGARNRGARRIVCGGKDARKPETCFYTQDHYQSFQLIDPSR
jgi:ribonuclease T1